MEPQPDPAPPTPPSPRPRGRGASAGLVAGLACTVWALSAGLAQLSDNSFLTHLATGRLILDTGRVPTTDPYSFTAAGEPFLVQSWLASVLYAAVERVAGGVGLSLLMGATTAALGALVWRLSRPAGDLLGRAVPTALVMAVGVVMWSERPLLFGLLFLGLVVLAGRGELDPRWLVPVGWLWVNTHGSFPYGVLVLVLMAAGARLDGVGWHVQLRALRWLAGGLALGIVNPLGWRIFTSPLQPLLRGEQFRAITEWQATQYALPFQYAFLATLGLAGIALVRRPSWRAALPTVVFALLGISAARNMTVFGIVALPAIAGGLAGIGTIPTGTRGRVPTVAAAGLLLLGAGFVGAATQRDGIHLADQPLDALAHLDRQGLLRDPGRRMATPDVVGNTLEHLLGPDARAFVDDRVDVYPAELYDDYRLLRDGDPRWAEVLDRWGVDLVLWERDEALATIVGLSPAWTTLYADDDWIVARRVPPG